MLWNSLTFAAKNDMPNYAYTSHHITGDANEVRKLHEALQRVDNHPEAAEREKEYYGHMWWGYVLQELLGHVPDLDCRGQVCDYGLDAESGALSLFSESAWSAPFQIHEVLIQLFPSLRILYFVDPDDDGLMLTNDVKGEVFTTRYGIATEDDDEQFFDTEEEMFRWFSNRFGIKVGCIDDVENAIIQLNDEQDFSVNLHTCLVEE